MTRRTDFVKANTYTGQALKGLFQISWKIDGVRLLYRDGQIVTRNNKVPPGMEKSLTERAKATIREYGDCEVYTGSFFSTNGPLQQHDPEEGSITSKHVYPLFPMLDDRLIVGNYVDPTPEKIDYLLGLAVDRGYEGLVIRASTNKRMYRVKPEHTADVRVTGYFEQLDKNKVPKGQLGGFDTNYGKVTAFTEVDRQAFWVDPEPYVGRMIEVTFKERYYTGKFRYAVKFNRFRDDKDTESFDTKGV